MCGENDAVEGYTFILIKTIREKIMKHKFTYSLTTSLALAVMCLGSTMADEAMDARIAQAESAAPALISKSATITEVDGTVLREGSKRLDLHAGPDAPETMHRRATTQSGWRC